MPKQDLGKVMFSNQNKRKICRFLYRISFWDFRIVLSNLGWFRRIYGGKWEHWLLYDFSDQDWFPVNNWSIGKLKKEFPFDCPYEKEEYIIKKEYTYQDFLSKM